VVRPGDVQNSSVSDVGFPETGAYRGRVAVADVFKRRATADWRQWDRDRTIGPLGGANDSGLVAIGELRCASVWKYGPR